MRRPLVSLVALGVVLRLALPLLAYWTTGSLQVYFAGHWRDSGQYLLLAASLLETGQYQTRGLPELFRPPGFPLFLVPAVASAHPLAVTVLLNAAVGGLTIALAYVTARQIAGQRAAWWAGLLCALEPGQILHSGFVMAEPLLAALVTATACAGVAYLRTGQQRWLLVLGLTVAGSAYVKTIAYFLPLWVAAALWLASERPLRRRTADAVLFLLVGMAALGAWHLRNWAAAGYAGFSTQIVRAALLREAAGVRVRQDGVSLREAQRLEAEAARTAQGNDMGDSESSGRMWARFLDVVRNDPVGFAALHLWGGLKVVAKPWEAELVLEQVGRRLPEDGGLMPAATAAMPGEVVDLAGRRGRAWIVTTAVSLVVSSAYLCLAALGTASGQAARLRIWLVALSAYFVLFASGTAALYEPTRFRVPIMPVVSVLGGCWVSGRLRERP